MLSTSDIHKIVIDPRAGLALLPSLGLCVTVKQDREEEGRQNRTSTHACPYLVHGMLCSSRGVSGGASALRRGGLCRECRPASQPPGCCCLLAWSGACGKTGNACARSGLEPHLAGTGGLGLELALSQSSYCQYMLGRIANDEMWRKDREWVCTVRVGALSGWYCRLNFPQVSCHGGRISSMSKMAQPFTRKQRLWVDGVHFHGRGPIWLRSKRREERREVSTRQAPIRHVCNASHSISGMAAMLDHTPELTRVTAVAKV